MNNIISLTAMPETMAENNDTMLILFEKWVEEKDKIKNGVLVSEDGYIILKGTYGVRAFRPADTEFEAGIDAQTGAYIETYGRPRPISFGDELNSAIFTVYPVMYDIRTEDAYPGQSFVETRNDFIYDLFKAYTDAGLNSRHAKNPYKCKSFMDMLETFKGEIQDKIRYYETVELR